MGILDCEIQNSEKLKDNLELFIQILFIEIVGKFNRLMQIRSFYA